MGTTNTCELCGRKLLSSFHGKVCPMCKQQFEAMKQKEKKKEQLQQPKISNSQDIEKKPWDLPTPRPQINEATNKQLLIQQKKKTTISDPPSGRKMAEQLNKKSNEEDVHGSLNSLVVVTVVVLVVTAVAWIWWGSLFSGSDRIKVHNKVLQYQGNSMGQEVYSATFELEGKPRANLLFFEVEFYNGRRLVGTYDYTTDFNTGRATCGATAFLNGKATRFKVKF